MSAGQWIAGINAVSSALEHDIERVHEVLHPADRDAVAHLVLSIKPDSAALRAISLTRSSTFCVRCSEAPTVSILATISRRGSLRLTELAEIERVELAVEVAPVRLRHARIGAENIDDVTAVTL